MIRTLKALTNSNHLNNINKLNNINNIKNLTKSKNPNNLNVIYANCSQGQRKPGVGKVLKNLGSSASLLSKYDDCKINIPSKTFNNKNGYYKLRNAVYNIHKSGKKAFTIGGDHSVAIGTVSGSLDYYKNDLTTVWVDAHADINTYEKSTNNFR